MVEEGYEFFARRQLVTIFSAPNYCGEFDNAGAMMSVDDTLMCSFQVRVQWATARRGSPISVTNLRRLPDCCCFGGAVLTTRPYCTLCLASRYLDILSVLPQILKPAEKKQKYLYARPATPPRG